MTERFVAVPKKDFLAGNLSGASVSAQSRVARGPR